MLLCCAHAGLNAQDLEPRAYSPSPIGVNFAVLGFAHSSGDVLLDSSLPLSNVNVKLDASIAGYGHTFDWLGRSANVVAAIPIIRADASGDVGENRREVRREGFGDVRLRLAVNLIGGEAMTPAQFAARTPRTSLGASIVVIAPVGEYDSAKLINLGAHRWAFKPELGLSQPIGRWYLEMYTGIWLFTDNDDFFGGHKRQEDPITTVQAHVSYTFRPQLWVAANATYYRGGKTTVDERKNDDELANSRLGATLSLPMGKRQSVKFSWSNGLATRNGGDFESFAVAWQFTWFD